MESYDKSLMLGQRLIFGCLDDRESCVGITRKMITRTISRKFVIPGNMIPHGIHLGKRLSWPYKPNNQFYKFSSVLLQSNV